MMRLIRKTMHAFIANEQGVAFIEFAYCIGLLMLLLWGGVEVSRYVLIMQKLQDAASQETNIIGATNLKAGPVSQMEMTAILGAVGVMMNPYSFTFNTTNVVIVTDIVAPVVSPPLPPNAPTPTKVQWRYCNPAGGGGAVSKLGNIGGSANLSGFPGFVMAPGDEIIVTEVYYQFSPIIQNAITTAILPVHKLVYVESLGVPRFGSLANLVTASNCP